MTMSASHFSKCYIRHCCTDKVSAAGCCKASSAQSPSLQGQDTTQRNYATNPSSENLLLRYWTQIKRVSGSLCLRWLLAMQNDCIQLYWSETQELQKYDTDEFPSFGSSTPIFGGRKEIFRWKMLWRVITFFNMNQFHSVNFTQQ